MSALSVRKSTGGGIVWMPAVLTDPPGFHDTEMITVDDAPSSPYVRNVHNSYNGGSQQFTASTDGGFSFSSPLDIHDVGGISTPITGTSGEIYVVGWALKRFRS